MKNRFVSFLTILLVSGCGTVPPPENTELNRSEIREDEIQAEENDSLSFAGTQQTVLTADDAELEAIEYLQDRGLSVIMIAETSWIAAPVGAYLVDARGRLSENGKTYTLFRCVVRDGTEGNPGEVIGFIAKGENFRGETVWYPEPGPDYRPADGDPFPEELFVYEFLLGRERFEAIQNR
jgi:hypothetical protein